MRNAEEHIGPVTVLRVEHPLDREHAADLEAWADEKLSAGERFLVLHCAKAQYVDSIGLETMLAAALRLYHSGELGLLPLLRAMTVNPAKLLGLPSGRLQKGAPADLILVDLDQPWVVDKALFRSRSKNTPFDETRMQGRVLLTMVAGTLAYEYSDAGGG